ncbi:DUF1700 domain-containing protein [Clostridium culturomicium]|uniref:DUF1700 domain-containing protein n=1 Tax=Clostridium culturomicium TaxID=1499683 RepID=UPI0005900645|nr:DUF1700 domain-containing protein [Clostridium culturomicium]
MSRVEFIEILNFELGAIKKIEREKFITYYEEIIDDYMENGFEEEEVIDKIGNPKIIAKNILSEQDTVNIKVPLTNSKVINMILLIIGFPLWGSLLFAGLMLILSGLILVWCIPFTTGVGALAFFAAGLYSIVATPFMMADVLSVGVVQLGVGVGFIGVSFLLAMATMYLCKEFRFFTKELSSRLLKLFNRKVVQL